LYAGRFNLAYRKRELVDDWDRILIAADFWVKKSGYNCIKL